MPARRRIAAPLTGVLVALLLVACGSVEPSPSSTPTRSATPIRSATPTRSAEPSAAPHTSEPTPSPSPTEDHPDPRWRFFTGDHHWYASPWFAGVHRIMIGFGCNGSPWYDHDPRCPGREGFHHGIDVAMPCGTPLRAGLAGVVLAPAAPGTPGAAYGIHPFRIRVTGPAGPHDILIGHARTVFVRPGQHVRVGQRIALASNSGAPDGCHLHFEVRPVGGSYTAAIDPRPWLMLTRWSSAATTRR